MLARMYQFISLIPPSYYRFLVRLSLENCRTADIVWGYQHR